MMGNRASSPTLPKVPCGTNRPIPPSQCSSTRRRDPAGRDGESDPSHWRAEPSDHASASRIPAGACLVGMIHSGFRSRCHPSKNLPLAHFRISDYDPPRNGGRWNRPPAPVARWTGTRSASVRDRGSIPRRRGVEVLPVAVCGAAQPHTSRNLSRWLTAPATLYVHICGLPHRPGWAAVRTNPLLDWTLAWT